MEEEETEIAQNHKEREILGRVSHASLCVLRNIRIFEVWAMSEKTYRGTVGPIVRGSIFFRRSVQERKTVCQ